MNTNGQPIGFIINGIATLLPEKECEKEGFPVDLFFLR